MSGEGEKLLKLFDGETVHVMFKGSFDDIDHIRKFGLRPDMIHINLYGTTPDDKSNYERIKTTFPSGNLSDASFVLCSEPGIIHHRVSTFCDNMQMGTGYHCILYVVRGGPFNFMNTTCQPRR